MRLERDHNKVTLLWAGDVPSELAEFVAQRPHGVVVEIAQVPFSTSEFVAECRRLLCAAEKTHGIVIPLLGPSADMTHLEATVETGDGDLIRSLEGRIPLSSQRRTTSPLPSTWTEGTLGTRVSNEDSMSVECVCRRVPDMPDQSADLEAEIAQAARELGVPGIAMGVEHGGQREIVTYGVTGVEHGRPIDEGTLFQIGSTAKTFTATAIMVLVEQGRIELDLPVRRYVPELRLGDVRTAETLTVGQLLNHTAGWDGGDTWTDTGEGDDALERAVALLADLPQQFAAGTGASYNSTAFVLAGRVVEKVTGETYERALARLVLDPLGLRQTMTSLNEIMTRSFALGHRTHGSADRTLSVCRPWSDPRAYLPAGARLASSVGDQLTWARFQLGDGRSSDGTQLLAEHRLRAMHAPTTSHELLPGVGVGIGWLLREIDGVRLVEHHGDVSGQHSSVTMVPDRDCAIVVLTNASPTGRELAERLVRRTLETRLGLVERSPEPLLLGPDELASYAGTYRTEGIELRVVVAGSGLVIHGTVSDGDVPGETLEFPVSLLAGERFLVVDGPFTGLRGEFVREGGVVVAARHVGRLVPRTADAS